MVVIEHYKTTYLSHDYILTLELEPSSITKKGSEGTYGYCHVLLQKCTTTKMYYYENVLLRKCTTTKVYYYENILLHEQL